MPLNHTLSDLWCRFQGELFPELANEVGPLGEKHRKLVAVLDAAPVESLAYGGCSIWRGRPPEDRSALARSFVAKAIWDLPTTRGPVDRIEADPKLRRLCGWSRISQVPSESTFSRAFKEFAEIGLPDRMHRALVEDAYRDTIIGHVSRDSTAIKAREKPAPKPKAEGKPKRRRGRPKKGEERPKEPSRLESQLANAEAGMKAVEMAAELPAACDVGAKKNAKGHLISWIGYKLHIDAADGGIPVNCLLTSASLHDSQAAIPLAAATGERVDHLYELMDSAYDSREIKEYSRRTGKVAIIDVNPRRDRKLKEALAAEAKAQRAAGHIDPKAVRYGERSTVERADARLKDEFGGRHVRVRGHAKVLCHLMFGIVAPAVDQLLRTPGLPA